MANNAERLSELLEIIGTAENDTERDSAGDRIIRGCEQLLKNIASKVVGMKLIICNVAVKWWDEKVKEAIGVRRGAYAKYTWDKSKIWQDGRSMLRLERK